MNNIAVVLRRQATLNLFHEAVMRTIRSPQYEKIFLCSGFFQEGQSYSVSNALLGPRFCQHRATPLELVVVGVHNPQWRTRFNTFVQNLRNIACPSCLTVTQRSAQHWHAKIFIAFSKNRPCFGIIGSSNMTRPAFDTTSPFNFEADVFLWEKTIPGWTEDRDSLFSELEGIHDFFFSTYSEGGPNGLLTVSERLQKLNDEIMDNSSEA